MFLVLDFTQSLRLAIINNEKLIIKEIKTKKNISEILIFEIEKFLKNSKTSIKNIKSICVVKGPGSFTGIRSALTFAKSIKLTSKIDIFGVSKFEIINCKIQLDQLNKKKCILLHFKGSQFFMQTFKGYKALDEAKLIDFYKEEFRYCKQILYVYDNIIFEDFLGKKLRKDIFKNLLLVEYNLNEFKESIVNNTIDNFDPKPLYISNYY